MDSNAKPHGHTCKWCTGDKVRRGWAWVCAKCDYAISSAGATVGPGTS